MGEGNEKRKKKNRSEMIAAGTGPGLTVPFAVLCIVDLLGVFPVVVLPGPIIKCGKRDAANGRYDIILLCILCIHTRMVRDTVGRYGVCGTNVHGRFVGKMLDNSRGNRPGHQEKKPVTTYYRIARILYYTMM